MKLKKHIFSKYYGYRLNIVRLAAMPYKRVS